MEGMVDHLAFERNNSQFDVDEMKIVWAGSRHAFEVSDKMARLVASDPVNSLFTLFNFVHSVVTFFKCSRASRLCRFGTETHCIILIFFCACMNYYVFVALCT